MSAQLYDPNAKKLVDVDPKQIPTLTAAGWLSPSDKKVDVILKKAAEEAEKAAEEAEKAAK